MAKKKTKEPGKGLLKMLWPFMRPHRRLLGLGIALIAASTVAEVWLPRLIGQAVDTLKSERFEAWDVRRYTAMIIGLALFAGVCRFFMRQTVIGRSRHIEYDLRRAFHQKLLGLSPSFYDRERTGDIMERASGDMEAVRMFLGPGVMHSTNTMLLLPLSLALLFSINAPLTVVGLVPFIALAVGVRVFGSRIYDRSKDVQDHLSVLSAMVQENLSGIRVVQAFGQEENQTNAFADMNEENVKRSISLAMIQAAFFPFLMTTAGFGLLMVIWIGGRIIVAPDATFLGMSLGHLTIGQLTTFTMLMGSLIWPVIALGWTVNLHQRGTASMRRIAKVLDFVPLVREPENALDRTDLPASVDVKGLTFRYPNPPSIVYDATGGRMLKKLEQSAPAGQAKPAEAKSAEANGKSPDGAGGADECPVVLNDVSVSLAPGQTLGVVGPIGSGKSTLAKLIGRLYPFDDGKVFFGGEDVNRLSLAALRRQVGFVFQETFLFSDSIANNVRFGHPDATDADVERVCKIASVHDDIVAFPKGYGAMLGERGINLSGGQKQRVAIARALLYDPKLLILDDALSAVDAETEEKILHALRDTNKQRSVIIIAHRLSTLRDADQIVVLDGGRITERGSHDELLRVDGLYARLWRMQQLEAEIAAQA